MIDRTLMEANDVARVLGISKMRVYELIRRQIIPSVRLGHQVRVDPLKLEEWIGQGGSSLK